MTGATTKQLTVRDRAILDFERTWWLRTDGGPKRMGIHKELHISATSYYSALERLIDDAAAARYDPLVVARLRRRRLIRRRALFVSALSRPTSIT